MTRRSYEIRADGVHFASEHDRIIAALEAQVGEQFHAAAQLAEAVVRLTDERDKLKAQNKALRDALGKCLDECNRYMNTDEAIDGLAAVFAYTHAALAATEPKP